MMASVGVARSTDVLPAVSPAWQLDMLMEKLRAKANQMRSLPDAAKAMKMMMLEKRLSFDMNERAQVVRCLDTLRKSLKVTCLQDMLDRLEYIARQLGLKWNCCGKESCFISSDTFYVEVLLSPSGHPSDVKISHESAADHTAKSCPELRNILCQDDFPEFTRHLKGLISIYQVNDDKTRSKVWVCLSALEADLETLANLQRHNIQDPSSLVHKSPIGVLHKRVGGQGMRLTYFISPYHLLDVSQGRAMPLSIASITEKGLGEHVEVTISSSIRRNQQYKLQSASLLTIQREASGRSLPMFGAISAANSFQVGAVFALKLPEPSPVCTEILKKMQLVTSVEPDATPPESLFSLITQTASKGQLTYSSSKGLFVTLPDQQHCYFLVGAPDMSGSLVTCIPFTHPTHVPQILMQLRQQALLNCLLNSCIRTCSKQDVENAVALEVMVVSWHRISVSFEHPHEDMMMTAEIDLSDISAPTCNITDFSLCPEDYATKVLQRCLSIPVTMRAILKRIQMQQLGSGRQSGGDKMVSFDTLSDDDVASEPTKFISEFGTKLNGKQDMEFEDLNPGQVYSKNTQEEKKAKKRKNSCEMKSPKNKEETCAPLEGGFELPPGMSISRVTSLIKTEEKSEEVASPDINLSPFAGLGLEKRPGIELIPLNSQSNQSRHYGSGDADTKLPHFSEGKKDEKVKVKLSESEKRSRSEKKERKRKKEDGSSSERPSKSLATGQSSSKSGEKGVKSLTLSIKTSSPTHQRSESSKAHSLKTCSPTRKRSSSPKPHLLGSKTASPKHSPKHSSKHSSNSRSSVSPKKTLSKVSSKPTATHSRPSSSPPKLLKVRDKDKKVSSSSSSTSPSKLSSNTSPKVKPSPESSKVSTQTSRGRKGSLSAVIDKLRSAQGGDMKKPTKGGKEKGSHDAKKEERLFNVETSSQGLKLLFKKGMDGSSKGSIKSHSSKVAAQQSARTGSPTGLKPGVSSGPASKKLSKSSSSKDKLKGDKVKSAGLNCLKPNENKKDKVSSKEERPSEAERMFNKLISSQKGTKSSSKSESASKSEKKLAEKSSKTSSSSKLSQSRKDQESKNLESSRPLNLSVNKTESDMLTKSTPPVFPEEVMNPSQPSVSIHIVKSPAPPLTALVSPCSIDDDLMDEALVLK